MYLAVPPTNDIKENTINGENENNYIAEEIEISHELNDKNEQNQELENGEEQIIPNAIEAQVTLK